MTTAKPGSASKPKKPFRLIGEANQVELTVYESEMLEYEAKMASFKRNEFQLTLGPTAAWFGSVNHGTAEHSGLRLASGKHAPITEEDSTYLGEAEAGEGAQTETGTSGAHDGSREDRSSRAGVGTCCGAGQI
jgi:hypothetical protein